MATTARRTSLQFRDRSNHAGSNTSLSSLSLSDYRGGSCVKPLDRNSLEKPMVISGGIVANFGTNPAQPRGGMPTSSTFPRSISRCRNHGTCNEIPCSSTSFSSIKGKKRTTEPYTEIRITQQQSSESKNRKWKEWKQEGKKLKSQARIRTFPLSTFLRAPSPHSRPDALIANDINALDFLYLGHKSVYLRTQENRSLTVRAAKSLIFQDMQLRQDIGVESTKRLSESLFRNQGNDPNSNIFQGDLNEPKQFVEELKRRGLIKGHFKLLEAARLDLPSQSSANRASVWVPRMSKDTQVLFSDPQLREILKSVNMFLQRNPSIPAPRVHARQNQYALFLSRMESAGMLEWSTVRSEDPSYTRLADALTMTSFAVMKDETKDRFISWPRVQNLAMPDPPHTPLPNPGHFSRLRWNRTCALSGFYMDIKNMFHNVRLPPKLISLFPLMTIAYGNLPGSLQLLLQQRFGYRPEQSDKLRPMQCTLPMEFKWAVHIAHHFVESCSAEALEIFMKNSKAFGLKLAV